MKARFSQLAAMSFALFGLACAERIQHGLDERQANELMAVLRERGFEAEKVLEAGKKPTWSIEVRGEQAADAVRVLAELGLPRPKAPTTVDVLAQGALVPTPTEERARQMVGLAGDLAATLETIDGVTAARVHLALPPPPRPGQPPGETKASAYLRARPGSAERLEQAKDEIRALLAGGVEGLSREQVTLVVTEVASSVPPPKQDMTPLARLRMLLLLLAISTSVLAVTLVLVTLRLRSYRDQAAAAQERPTAPAKPVVSPSAARKAA